MKGIVKRLTGMAVAALAALSVIGLTVTPAQAAAEPVYIGSTVSSTFVTANTVNPDLFMQPPSSVGAVDFQQWVLKIDEKTNEGLVINTATAGCLAVYRVVIGDRRPVVQRPCDGQPTEVWSIRQAQDGSTMFVNTYTGRCMGYEPLHIGRYPQLLEYACTGAVHQTFRLKRAG